MRVTILGCGGSGGVPLVGCTCAVCRSTDPRNQRTRVSIVVEDQGSSVLVDSSPDLRQQLLSTGITRFDAAILTHAHADHLHGLDDLRAVNHSRNAPLDVWADPHTLAEAKRRFGYAFNPPRTNQGIWYAPSLVGREIAGTFTVGALSIVPFRQIHGGDRDPTLGLRFGRFAYSTDVREMPEEGFAVLEGVDVWIVDCLQDAPNPAHSHLAQTLEWVRRVRPKLAVLTHMSHRLEYHNLAGRLPQGVTPGHDGMVIDIESASIDVAASAFKCI